MIIANNLNKHYKNEIIFQDLNFQAKKGKLTIIQGKSGSGKTTLLNILSTIDQIENNGSLIINDIKVDKLNEHERAKFRATNIGFIFQSYALIPEFSVIENCTIPLTMSGINEKKAIVTAKKIIKELIHDADEEFYKKNPTQLSGGQQQRVSIARALIHQPDIIIADEPTANLDEEASTEVKKWLKLLTSRGKTVIVVTHEKDYLNYADILFEFEQSEKLGVKSKLKEAKCLNL